MSAARKLLVGVDVGGTNTDVVIIDPSRLSEANKGVLAWKKTITTPDVSHGIEASIRELLQKNDGIKGEDIMSLTIGTTHFINAVIERNMSRLQKVAVIRISGPYGRSLPPFGDFPDDLGQVLNAYIGIIDGGFQITGKDIRKLDENALRKHCAAIKKLNISAIAVVATFSTINNEHELRAAKIILEEIPEADIVLSHTISGIGFIERENATILNASIRRYGREIISSFLRLRDRLGLSCTLLLSQNDGTVLSAKNALETPIRTFSSGATNSMRGAAILCSTDPDVEGKNVIVCDVGGTTTDVGQLLASGFPRQSSTYSYVGGVRMNFSMPLVQSCGLGGGSIVKCEDGEVIIGPESTGAEIVKHARIFGGDVLTTTDVTVGTLADKLGVNAIGDLGEIGETNRVCNNFSDDFKSTYQDAIQKRLEIIIGRLKTSPDPLPVIFVGGGSFIAPSNIEGASKVITPPYYQVANAIGAALAKVSSEVQEICTIVDPEVEVPLAIQRLTTKAKNEAISKGADERSLHVMDIESESVPYVDKVYSIRIKVIGDVDYTRVLKDTEDACEIVGDYAAAPSSGQLKLGAPQLVLYDYEQYKPSIKDREWILSEIDIDFISVGAYILGCGGGGDPHSETIELKHIIRNGGVITVLTLDDFAEKTNGKGRAVSVGYCGSPTISLERLHGDEILHALENIEKWEGRKVEAISLFEIGGSNGLSGLWVSHKRNLPCIDLDLMGRAYPTQWQSLPSVCANGKGFPYVGLSDGNGISMIFTNTVDDIQTESLIRDVMNNHGVQCGIVEPSTTIEQMRRQTVSNSLSLAWRIGRAVHIARYKSDLDNLPSYIIDAAGGPSAAKCLFKGKIVGVQRKLERGYGYGIVILKGVEDNSTLKIPFKNENIVVYKVSDDGKDIPLCSVPDLITLVDMDGNAVGTQEYKYGLEVYLMVLAPSDAWTTPQGIKVGGPPGFGPEFENIEYKPVGKYIKPVAVVDEFSD